MNELEKLFAKKRTENGDISYTTTSNNLLDILFMTAYFETHLNEVKIGQSDKEKLFAMFIRDPRFGLGRRDLGRELMKQSNVNAENIVKAGRFDDLFFLPTNENLEYLMKEVRNGNVLAKKWMPRLTSKNKAVAKAICRMFDLSEKQYRKLIKVRTVEALLSAKKINEIDFEKVPSLAMVKYYNCFMKEERFRKYIDSVKKGEKKLNISTTTVYDIYKNRNNIDAQLFFDKLEKISINCVPILDTSGSMQDMNDSIGKATSIAHYLAKCSTFAKDYVVSFSSHPQLIHMGYNREGDYWHNHSNFEYDNTQSQYINEVNSLYTGDWSNTDFGAVMELFRDMQEVPKYLVVLSDMEFDEGSTMSKDETMSLFRQKGYNTKIIWWNFNARNTTVPEMDGYGNIYISGYSPYLLKFLESGFNGQKFLDKLLEEYKIQLEKNS